MLHATMERTDPTTPPVSIVSPSFFPCDHRSGRAGRHWRSDPTALSSCCDASAPGFRCGRATFLLQQFTLVFAVTRNEEYVHLSLVSVDRELDLGARNHNYLLLTLARRRLQDRRAGAPDDSCGWVDLESWSHDPSMRAPRLNVDVFRIRRQFGGRGVVDARGVIERRTPMRQIRLGTARVQIRSL